MTSIWIILIFNLGLELSSDFPFLTACMSENFEVRHNILYNLDTWPNGRPKLLLDWRQNVQRERGLRICAFEQIRNNQRIPE